MSKLKKLEAVRKIIGKEKSVAFDVGCGGNKAKGFIGMDIRKLPGVDIVHDLEVFPYPVPDGCCHTIRASHIYEHIKPWLSIKFMDELWRMLKVGGALALGMPYGVNDNYQQDPTHCNPANFATWQYFDPRYPLYDIYEPEQWEIGVGFPAYQQNGNMEVFMEKIKTLNKKQIEKLRLEYWENRR